MSANVMLGLLFALATALASIIGFLYKQRGAAASPAVSWRSPVGSSVALLRNRWFAIGMAIAMGSWGLHVTALALAPITLVQTVIAGSLVMLTVLADRVFGFDVSRREWAGVAATAAGLAVLAATLGNSAASAHNHYDGPTLALYVGALAAVSVVLCASVARGAGGALSVATAAGLQWGASDVTIKALSGHLHADGLAVLASPLALVILVLSLVGMVVSARSMQLGAAVPVIAVTSVSANLVTIASGLVVFGEPLADGATGRVLRLLAFAVVVVAAALTPAPATRRADAA